MKNDRYLIGVSGGSGSGKTRFIKYLKANFMADEVAFVSQDDYYKPREQQIEDENGFKNFDLPSSILGEKLVVDTKSLLNGHSIFLQKYTFNNSLAVPNAITINPAPVIIVEGLFVYYFEELSKLMNLKIFIHAEDTIKINRRIKRDNEERNYPLEDVLYRYEHHVKPSYDKFIFPYIKECDIVINNNHDFITAVEMISEFISNKISHSEN